MMQPRSLQAASPAVDAAAIIPEEQRLAEEAEYLEWQLEQDERALRDVRRKLAGLHREAADD